MRLIAGTCSQKICCVHLGRPYFLIFSLFSSVQVEKIHDPLLGKLQLKWHLCAPSFKRVSPASGMTETLKNDALAREASVIVRTYDSVSRDCRSTRGLKTTKFFQSGRSGTLCTRSTLSNIS